MTDEAVCYKWQSCTEPTCNTRTKNNF